MARPRIVLNNAGVAELLKLPAVQADLARRAAAIAAAASQSGGDFGHDSGTGRNRARASAWTNDTAAREAEATDRSLTRAIDAGRS